MTSHPGDDRSGVDSGTIIPGRFNGRVAKGFGWYVERLLRRRFNALRVLGTDAAVLEAVAGIAEPVVALINHPSWWDPLTALVLSRRFMPERIPSAPMEAAQLRRFGIFRSLGVFGVEPEARDAMAQTLRHVADRFAHDARPLFWITPQGRFTDAREPIRLHPGAAAVAARHAGCRVVAVAVEYVFWNDQRPEVLVCCARVAEPATAASTSSWQRAIQSTMERNAGRLAAAARARDERAFTAIVGGGAARIHPVYDAWLRLRGRHGAIVDRRSRDSGTGGDR